MEYYYDDVLRWSLFFSQPNHAAAFLVCIYPFVFCLSNLLCSYSKNKGIMTLLFGCEVLVMFFLLKTLSKGGGLTLIFLPCVALVSWGIIDRKKRSLFVSNECKVLFLFRAFAFLLMGCFTRFFERGSPSVVLSENGTWSRFDMILSGLDLIKRNFWFGIGHGKSGVEYMNWYQPVDESYEVLSLLNGYLTFFVDYGAVASLGFFTIYFSIIVYVFIKQSLFVRGNSILGRYLLQSAMYSVVASSVMNVFIVLYSVKCLFVLVSISFGFLSFLSVYLNRSFLMYLKDMFKIVMIVGGCLCVCVLISVFCLGRQQSKVISVYNGYVEVEDREDEFVFDTIYFLPDSRVLGVYWGKAIRAMSPLYKTAIVSTDLFGGYSGECDMALYFGGSVNVMGSNRGNAPVVGLVNPIADPSSCRWGEVDFIIMHDVELYNSNYALWERYSNENDIPFILMSGVGPNVTSQIKVINDVIRELCIVK